MTFKRIPHPAVKQVQAFVGRIDDICHGTIEDLMEELMPRENTLKFYHGMQVRQGNSETENSIRFQDRQVDQFVKKESILANDLSALPTFIDEITRKFVSQMKQLLFQRVEESDGRAGGAISLKDKSPEVVANDYLEFWKRMEFSVDKNGQVVLPELRMHPDVSRKFQAVMAAQSPEFHRQVESVIEERKSEALRIEQLRLARFKSSESEQ